MGKSCCLILAAIGVIGCAIVAQRFWNATRPLPLPHISLDEHWGSKSAAQAAANAKTPASTAIEPQEIYYSPETIAELHAKLNETLPLHEPLEDMKHPHDYGLNPGVLYRTVQYWRQIYLPKWPERLERLNSVPHFKTEIQGLAIHFIHIKPTPVAGKTIVPMLLLHGWPGSVREFYDIFPLLTQPQPHSPYLFEVIAPSLPGFAWSEGARRVNFGPAEIAVVVRNLMLRVGHERFVVQGGDWGSIVGSNVATLFPENVLGYHSNFCVLRSTLSTVKLLVASLYPRAFLDEAYESFVFPLGAHFKQTLMMSGYFHLQATKPDTIGIALTRNPVGLLAYVYEKFVAAYPTHDLDAILDNIMIYYLTNSAHTSGRIYAEFISDHQSAYELQRVPVTVPAACARFRRDISHSLDWQLRDKYVNLVQSTWYLEGGHFAAMEVPDVLYKDFVQFVDKLNLKK